MLPRLRGSALPLRRRAFSISSHEEKRPDVIVLGAGSAGCTLASRLTEDSHVRVHLLEAGPEDRGLWDSWKIRMPSALTYNLADDKYNWDFHTVPQQHLDDRIIHQPRGRVLGGSSSLNAMVYIRGHALDYERWVEEGASGWSYAECLPYFRKAQTHESGADDYRGGSGPLYVSNGKSMGGGNELFNVFVDAAADVGYARTNDLNGYRQEGFGPMDQTVSADGVRCNASSAYLHPVLERENLSVETRCMVTEIITETTGSGLRAIGVKYVDGSGRCQTLHANKEVILSLGAIGSPHLLMASGIGDADALSAVGVRSTHHLPEVGRNLQDHLEFYLQYLCRKPVTLYPVGNWMPYPHKRISVGLEWFLRGTGMAASNQFETGGFIRSRAGLMHPDLQFHFVPGAVVGQLDFLPHHAYQAHCGTMRPTSRGSVSIQSSDVRVAPLIDPNYLATDDDREDLRTGFRLAEEILNAPAFDEYRGDALHAGDVDLDSDESVDRWIRKNSHSAYHPSCTCAMGRVVDSTGNVYGVEQLRVVDASIMPSMVSGNLNAPTIMIAEKCADAIRGRDALPSAEQVDYYVADDFLTSQR